MATIPSSEAHRALDLYRDLALQRFGDEIERIVLFGSRARGDWHEESDWDVAVFLRRAATPSDRRGMSDIGYEVMCCTGAVIQSVVLSAASWGGDGELIRNIRQEGTSIYAGATATSSPLTSREEASWPIIAIEDNLAKADRFAVLARKNDPADHEVVIHTTYYAMHHAARAALLAAKGSAPTKHGRVITSFTALAEHHAPARGAQYGAALQAACNLRITSDYDEKAGDLSADAVDVLSRMGAFFEFCRDIVAAHVGERPENREGT